MNDRVIRRKCCCIYFYTFFYSFNRECGVSFNLSEYPAYWPILANVWHMSLYAKKSLYQYRPVLRCCTPPLPYLCRLMCGHGYYRHKCSKSSEIVETETERSRLSVIKESKTIKVYCLNLTISVDPDPVPSCALSYIKHFIVVGDNVRCVFAGQIQCSDSKGSVC